MKILTVVCDLGKGGTQRAAVNFALGYKHLGHDSKVLTFRKDGVRSETLDGEGIQVLSADEAEDLEYLTSWPVDIIHLHSHGLTGDLVMMIVRLTSASTPTVVETSVFSEPQVWEHLLSYSFQMSKWGIWNYLRLGGDASKVALVPYPVFPSYDSSISK